MGSGRRLRILVEPSQGGMPEDILREAGERFAAAVKYRVTVTPEVQFVEPGSLPRAEGKAKRVIRE